jgi:hypothetical protein
MAIRSLMYPGSGGADGSEGRIPPCFDPFCDEPHALGPPDSGLPSDLAPWDLEDYAGVRELLSELAHQGALSSDVHLRLLAERYGVALATLQEAARDLGQHNQRQARRPFLQESTQNP